MNRQEEVPRTRRSATAPIEMHDEPERIMRRGRDLIEDEARPMQNPAEVVQQEDFASMLEEAAATLAPLAIPAAEAAAPVLEVDDNSISRQDVSTMIASALKAFENRLEASVTSIAEQTVADALEQCRHQRRMGIEDGPIAKALKDFVEDVLLESRASEELEKAVQAPTVIDVMTDKVLSSEKLTRPIARFVASQVSNAVKGMAEKEPVMIVNKTSPPPSRPPSRASSEDDSDKDPSPRRGRRRSHRSKSRRQTAERDGDSSSEDRDDRPRRREAAKLDTSSDETAGTSKSGRVPGVKIIRPVNELFRRALDYRTYRLINRSQVYDGSVARRISKLASRLEVQMKTNTFDSRDPVSVLSFLSVFRSACDSNGISEGAAMWLFHYFMKKTPAAALSSRLALEPARFARSPDDAHERLGSYVEVVNYLLATYATDDVIAETVGDILSIRQGKGTTAADFAQTLYDKVLRCGNVYPESQLKGIFVEGLVESVRDNMRVYWGLNRQVTLFQLARYADTLCKLNGTQSATTSTSGEGRSRGGGRGGRREAVASIASPSLEIRSERDGSASDSSQGSRKSRDNASHCRVCLSRSHRMDKCPFAKDHAALMEKRQANFDKHGRDIYKGDRRRPAWGNRKDKNEKTSDNKTQEGPSQAVQMNGKGSEQKKGSAPSTDPKA